MKATNITSNISMYPFGKAPMVFENEWTENCTNFLHTTVPPLPMIDQEIAPPLHVWEKISGILDEQDRSKSVKSSAIETLSVKRTSINKYLYVTIAATVAVTIIWFLL